MWNAHGAYVFHAEQLGAVPPLLALDHEPATNQFFAWHQALGSRVQFRQGDILKLDLATDGLFDVVFCSGVLYHMADPMMMLHRVAQVTRHTLILCTHTAEGKEPILRFYPHSPDPEPYPWEMTFGITPDWRHRTRYGDWIPWWYGPTEPCVKQMLRCVGFEVQHVDRYRLEIVRGHRKNPQISTFVAQRIP
jgi:SAM-dependent methyltransferase